MTTKQGERQRVISVLLEEVEDSMRSDDFQREFFESLQDQFHRRHDLSDKQIDCLRRMYDRVTDV